MNHQKKDQKIWLQEIVAEAESMDKTFYDHYIEELQKKNFSLEQARKSIFQTHNNHTDETLEAYLKEYYLSDEQDGTEISHYKTTRLSVVFYELKEKNPQKFYSLTLLIAGMKS